MSRKQLTFDTSKSGVCCKKIHVELADELIERIEFVNGCEGNHLAISSLVKGRPAEEVIHVLLGTTCGSKKTSCPDQLAKALQVAMKA